MAVIDVIKSFSNNANSKEDGQIGYTVLYDTPDIKNLAKTVTARDPNSGLKIPELGKPMPGDRFHKRVVDYNVNQLSPVYFVVIAIYSLRERTEKNSEEIFKKEPLIAYTPRPRLEEVDTDLAGNPIVNSVNELLNPKIKREIPDGTLSITRNEKYFYPTFYGHFWASLNNAEYLWGKKATWKCYITQTQVQQQAVIYFRTVYQFGYRAAGWPQEYWNMGTRERSQKPGNPYITIIGADGKPLKRAVPLTKDGKWARGVQAKPSKLKFPNWHFKNFDELQVHPIVIKWWNQSRTITPATIE